jgi:hypothetical protein
MSSKVVVAADGLTAVVTVATVTDIFTTLATTDSAITGLYGATQKAGLVLAGMMINSKRLRGSYNPFVAA